jgi:D-3-phosphoglycerate dehydrogenase
MNFCIFQQYYKYKIITPMDKIKILATQNIPKEGLKELYELYNVIMPEKAFSLDEQKKMIEDVDVLLSIFNMPVSKELIDCGKKLKMIANFGVGYNNIDIEHAKQKGITVTNTPDPVIFPTAEHTMGLMLSLMRRITEMDRKLRNNTVSDWKVMSNLGNTLFGKTLGLVGFGNIGKEVARLAQNFGMNVVYYKRNVLPYFEEQELHVKSLSFEELLQTADIISLHVPLTGETKHMLSGKEFALMKNSAFIVNTARGAVIDESVLINALQNRQIAGAGLDVFENEPQISPELLTFDNVVLTPHIGTGTIETRIDIAKCTADNIIDFLNGKTPVNKIV